MLGVFRRISSWLKYTSEEDKKFAASIKTMIGYRPFNISIYQLAIKHSSIAKTDNRGRKESNERLEYFGDAVLGLIIAEFLFERFPFRDEGFLTEMRSKIVNREALNQVGRKIGLHDLIQDNNQQRTSLASKSIYGDTLEALIGAVYLDLGYKKCRHFVIKRIIGNHFDINQLMNDNNNYKSLIIEWAQKENKSIDFVVEEIDSSEKFKQFEANVHIDGTPAGRGIGLSKKKAEQDAAQKALEKIMLNQE